MHVDRTTPATQTSVPERRAATPRVPYSDFARRANLNRVNKRTLGPPALPADSPITPQERLRPAFLAVAKHFPQ